MPFGKKKNKPEEKKPLPEGGDQLYSKQPPGASPAQFSNTQAYPTGAPPPYDAASAPPPYSYPQGGYAQPPQQGGYGPPPQQGGYGPPPQQGGYGPPQQQGYGPPQQQGPPPGQGRSQWPSSTVVVQGGFDAGARFDGVAAANIPPPPPGCAPNQAQMAMGRGQNVVVTQQKGNFWEGGSDGGYVMF